MGVEPERGNAGDVEEGERRRHGGDHGVALQVYFRGAGKRGETVEEKRVLVGEAETSEGEGE